jgi:uncharacterized protein (DUF1499 family)
MTTNTATAANARAIGVRRAWVVLWLAVACALAALLAGPGYRWGWWGLGAGIQTLMGAAIVAAVVFVLALLGSVLARRQRQGRSLALFLGAAALCLVTWLPPAALGWRARQLPPIHDISTDTGNPPQFKAVLPLRQGAPNSTAYSADVAAQQQRAYPEIAPALLALAAPEALARAERVARAMGWAIVAVAAGEGRIEATATTLLFGFKDDIVIRITPQGNGSRVDLRSLSRVGRSDLGVNASRIHTFLQKLQAEAAV